MKKIFNRGRDFYNNDEDFAGNWLYFTDKPGGPDGPAAPIPEVESNIEQKIDKCLMSPLGFGTKELRFLEKHQDKMTALQERRFRDLAGYQLSLSKGRDINELPPRMLNYLADSTLNKLLPIRMRKQIIAEVDTQMRALRSILDKNPDSWSSFELSKVCVLYRRLQKKAVGDDGSRDGLFEDARKKIVKKAFVLMVKPVTTSGRVDNTISKEDNKAMTLEEKLLVTEIRRMFPYEKSWAEKGKFYDWNRLAIEAVGDFIKSEGKRWNPNAAFTWELLRGFLGEVSKTESVESLKAKIIEAAGGEENINKFFKTTEAVKFLQFAKNSRVFLPTHLQALQQISKDKELLKSVTIAGEDDWEGFGEKSEDLKKLNKKRRELEDEKLEYKQQDFEEYFKKSEAEREKTRNEWEKAGMVDMVQLDANLDRYKVFYDKKKAFIDKTWSEKYESWIKDGKEAWEEIKDGQISDLELERDKELVKLNELPADSLTSKEDFEKRIKKRYEDKIKNIDKGIPAKFDKFEEKRSAGVSDFSEREEEIQKFRDFIHGQGEVIQKTEKFQNFDKEYKEYDKGLGNVSNKTRRGGNNELPLSKSVQEKDKKLDEKISKLTEEITTKTKELDAYKVWHELLKDPEKVAKDAEKTFINNLNTRIQNKTLYAADFEVLWDDDIMDEENPEYERFRQALKDIPNREKIDEFREKFAGILNGIFDEVELPRMGDSDDKYSPWYRKLDDALSYDNIIARLKEEGFDLRKEFPAPQQITQLIDGAVRSYRDKIFNSVANEIGEDMSEEEKQDFFTGWNRLHGGLDGATDPTEVHIKHLMYEQNKLKTSETIEKNHQANLAYVERLKRKAEETQDPAKKAHYLEEAKKLEESFDARRQMYQGGGNFWSQDENGETKKYWAPGKELLNELNLQTQSVSKEIKTITGSLRDEIAKIAENFRGISKMKDDPVGKRVRQAEARNSLETLISKWPGIRDQLRGKVGDMQTIMNEVVPEGVTPDQFVDVYLKVPNKMLDSFEETFKDLEKYAKKIDYKFTGEEPFWKIFADNFIKLESALDLQNGDLAQDSQQLEKYMEKANSTLEFLTKMQFFDDHTLEKDEFTKNYDEVAKGFKEDFAKYQEAVNDVDRRLRRDLRRMDDQPFFDKYGLNKEYMEEILNNHKNTSKKFREISDKFMKPGFLADWIHRYDDNPQERAEAIAEMGDFNSLRDHAKNARNYASDMQKWVANYDEVSAQKPQKQYQRFSLYDLFAIVKQAIEVNERRWKRNSDKAVAEIGMSFFGDKSPWGKEFKQKAEESENARVKEFETQYDEYPGWDLQDALNKANDPDEAKALITMMIDRGFLQWDDPGLWKTLMRLSNNAVTFNIPGDENLSPHEILDKVRNACEFIWSKETFRNWDTSHKSKLTSAIDGHDADFTRYENAPRARTKIMSDMLKRWKNGDSRNVDPAKFECFIRESFKKGKMNGQPDQRWYFMVMGVATINPKTGRSLLSRDVFMRMNDEFLTRFPHIDFLADKESWKLDGRIVPEGTPGAEKRGWIFTDYLKWGEFMTDGNGSFDPTSGLAEEQTNKFFYHIVHASASARDRVQRMDRFSDKEGDHDDAESFFADWAQEHIVSNMSKSSGGENKLSNDLWRRYLSGFPKYMKYMKLYIEEGDGKWGDSEKWREEKKRALEEVGDRLKNALTVTQTLQGNGNLGESRGHIVFGAEQWRKKGTGYSANADESRKTINSFMRDVFQEAGDDEKLDEILDFKGSLEFGIEFKNRDKKIEEAGIKQKMKKLLDGKESRLKYFNNTAVIEKVLKNWKGGDAGK